MKTRVIAALSAIALLGVLLVPGSVPPASADGSPDIALSKEMPAEVLLGEDIPVTLTLTNPLGPHAYNATFTDILPAGVSYVTASSSPEPLVLPQGDGTTALVWKNVADALTGTAVVIKYSISTDASFDVGDTVTNAANGYANSDPRFVPTFNATTGVVTGGFTGNAAASDSSELIPFRLTKDEPSAEDELLRGVHNHQTVFTLTIDNNLVNPSTGFSIVDHLPAQLEFLGCGAVDNSTGGDEYPGSGAINPGNEPTMANPCITPTSVTTVTTDPDSGGPLPNAVYTRIEWNSATLATDLLAAESFTMEYIAAIPLRENVQAALADPTANLDNNTGALTTESEGEIENYARAFGFYNGDAVASSDGAREQVVLEDIAIQKSVDAAIFVQGDAPVFTLDVQTSEYASSTGVVTVADTLPASLDFTSSSVVPSGQVLNADGTLTVTWELPVHVAGSQSTTITVITAVRETYRLGDGSAGSPVAANDSHQNTVALTADVTIISANDGTTTTLALDDESSASQSSAGPTILKEVSLPAGSLTCGDGTGVTFHPTTASSYRPGDRVCFRLGVDFPASLDTLDPVISDFLPDGFVLESWAAGAASDIAAGAMTFSDSSPLLEWELADQDVGGIHIEIVLSTIVTDPLAAAPTDLLDNLMKLRYNNQAGDAFQLRDLALAEWSEAMLTLDKGVIELNSTPVAGAPADGTTVQEGDDVTYQLNITNSGSETALDTSIRDVLPAEITCVDVTAISNGGACDSGNNWIQWDVADDLDIPAGNTLSLTYDVSVPVGISAGASLVNTAGVRTYGGTTNTGTAFTYIPANNIDPTLTSNTDAANDDSEIITALPVITKSQLSSIDEAGNALGDEATIGETISYTIDLDLPGGATYYAGEVTDLLDGEKDLQDATVAVTLDGAALPVGFVVDANDGDNSVTVTFPDPYVIPNGPDQEIIITFDAVLLDVASATRGSTSSNRVDFDYNNAASDARNANDSIATTVVEPNIVLDKNSDDADGTVFAGQTVTYTLDVTNDDSVARVSVAHDTVVVDTIPAELTVMEATGDAAEDGDTIAPDGGVWNAAARTITWTLGALDPGATTSLSYETETLNPLVAAGSLRNTAEATTSSMAGAASGERTSASPNGDADGDGYQDPAESTVSVPVLTLSKSATPATATIGEPVAYTVDVVIPSGVIAYDVTILDDLPAGITFESLTSVACDQGGGACSPDIVTVDAAVIEGGGDVAFFFDDLTTAAAAERTVTLTYVAVVANVAAANDGATLTNGADVHWNASDQIVSTPGTPPASGSFDDSSATSTASVDTLEPTLTVDKDVSGQSGDTDTKRAKPGEVLDFSIAVTNIGTGDAFNVVVSDIVSDDSWAFTDTTAIAGVANTDADPVGGLEWTIDGPIPASGTVTITYQQTVPASFTSADENAAGPELSNSADIPSYFAVEESARLAAPSRTYRDYDDVTPDAVGIEVDLASIGDRLWLDVDNDGVQDAGEPPLPDVTVTVTYLGGNGLVGGGDDELFVVVTDSDGLYVVDELPGGNYIIDVDETDPDFLAGLTASFDLDGTTLTPNGTWAGALGEDDDKRDVDFGYTGTGSIGDTIWLDQDLDGVTGASESGLGGVDVTVTWLGPDGVSGGTDDIEYSTTTNNAGAWLVENLPAGEYTAVVDTATMPAGYQNVSDPGGENDDRSDVTLGAGQDNLDQDFGYAGTGSIGDTVWLDQDGDGTQNGSEPGLGGVIVELTHFGPDGVPGGTDDSVFSTTTSLSGVYIFTDLPPGNYEVEVTGGVPANVTNSYDPDVGGPGDATSSLTLGDGEDNVDQDFGFRAESVLGDRVWWDINLDGIQQVDEPGLTGIAVTATFLGPDGTLGTVDDEVFMTATDSDGDYLFEDITDGDYIVAVTGGIPVGLAETYDENSGTAAPDATTTLTLSTEHLTADFGYAGSGSIGDSVWFDQNLDGIFGSGEFGLEGIVVELTWFGVDGVAGGTDDIVLTTTTDATGAYLFPNLPTGSFLVDLDETTLPAGLTATFDLDGGTSTPDGTTAVVLASSETVTNVDFGYAGSGSIGDTVWLDQDGDGMLGPDEAGIGNATVTLVWDGPFGPETLTTVTTSDGAYVFDNLPPGDHTITVDTASLPIGLSPTFDADTGLDDASALTLGDGENNLNQDFGYRGAATIGDTIWLDLDGDGVISLDEPAVPGQTVELVWQGPTGPVTFTTTTDTDGVYRFEHLPDGDFTVTVTAGIVVMAENTGDPGADGDSTNDLTIAGGADNLDQDFGYQGLNDLGDTVWVDHNRNGTIDANEQPIEAVEVTVTWFGPDGTLGGGDDLVLPVAFTDVDGLYSAASLPDGTFSIEVTGGLPAGLRTPTYDADSGTVEPDVRSIVTDLGTTSVLGMTDADQDFGFVGSGSIGDTIWLSLDGNDVQDAHEPGVPGVGVTLTGAGEDGLIGTADDVLHPPQTTDADGGYLFVDLPPGPYEVSYDATDLDDGVSPDVDPDDDDLATASVVLGPDEGDLTLDFGVIGDASVSGTIFVDADGDGLRSTDEEPIANVTIVVTWTGPDGLVEFTTITDSEGNWSLDEMPSGDYVAVVDTTTVSEALLPTIPTSSSLKVPPGGSAVAGNGFVASGTVGDLVWGDGDRDGVVDDDESGVAGVAVTLFDEGGVVVATTTTADDGTYLFDDVLPGSYTVSIDEDTFPAGVTIVAGPDGDTNNRATLVVGPGEDIDTMDFGLAVPPSAIPLAFTGTTIWNLILFALALLGAGAIVLRGSRRRVQIVIHLD